MIKNLFLYSPLIAMLAISCNQKNDSNSTPKLGTVLAKEEMPVVGDSLNKFTFSLTVKADSQIEKGVYDVSAVWGNNTAESKFTMPKGGEALTPILRKSSKPNAFIIGFKAGKDTTFNDYYEVSGVNGTIKMMYVKSYSFE